MFACGKEVRVYCNVIFTLYNKKHDFIFIKYDYKSIIYVIRNIVSPYEK